MSSLEKSLKSESSIISLLGEIDGLNNQFLKHDREKSVLGKVLSDLEMSPRIRPQDELAKKLAYIRESQVLDAKILSEFELEMSSIGEGAEASTMLLLELENERSQLTSRLAGSKEELRLQKAEAAEVEHAKAEHQAAVALAEEE